MAKKVAKKKTAKSKGGRPTKYSKEMLNKLLEFFDVELDRTVVKECAGKEGMFNIVETVPNRLPTAQGFCREMKISTSTLYKWASEHQEFSDTLDKCKAMQMNHLIQHALEGGYNAGFAKFLAVNISDYREKKEIDIGNKDDKGFSLAYNLKNEDS